LTERSGFEDRDARLANGGKPRGYDSLGNRPDASDDHDEK
jgi:hypothetical protein